MRSYLCDRRDHRNRQGLLSAVAEVGSGEPHHRTLTRPVILGTPGGRTQEAMAGPAGYAVNDGGGARRSGFAGRTAVRRQQSLLDLIRAGLK